MQAFVYYNRTAPRRAAASNRARWKRLNYSAREALGKDTAQRVFLFECRDDTTSIYKNGRTALGACLLLK